MTNISVRYLLKKLAAHALGNRFVFAATDHLINQPKFPFIRIVGYHDTPACYADRLEAQLKWFSENYVNCDSDSLDQFLRDGIWPHKKPGLIISFDDGLRSNVTIALPLLERFGLTGWFMVPSVVADICPPTDRQFAYDALIPFNEQGLEDRLFVSWEDLRSIVNQGHVVCCHSMHHKRLGEALSAPELIEEIAGAKAALERGIGSKVDSFAWVGGESYSFSSGAFEEMKRAGFDRIFSTNCSPILPKQSPLCLERNHVDAAFGLDEVRLSIGGLYDLFYRRKRLETSQTIGFDGSILR